LASFRDISITFTNGIFCRVYEFKNVLNVILEKWLWSCMS